jgi:hypothetical protein
VALGEKGWFRVVIMEGEARLAYQNGDAVRQNLCFLEKVGHEWPWVKGWFRVVIMEGAARLAYQNGDGVRQNLCFLEKVGPKWPWVKRAGSGW